MLADGVQLGKLLTFPKDDPDPDGRILKGVFPHLHPPVGNQVFPWLLLLVAQPSPCQTKPDLTQAGPA